MNKYMYLTEIDRTESETNTHLVQGVTPSLKDKSLNHREANAVCQVY